ncbi:MAG: type III pantothenate kinase [Lachnospiraceae bacterium]|nr:type III pantothenate kinase [Lachnospiraceae bacterium]
MLLTIDVGNTNITLGVYDKDSLAASFRMTTKMQRTSDELGLTISQLLLTRRLDPGRVDAIIISSVVPKIMHSLRNAIRKTWEIEPLIVGPDIKTGIHLHTDNPRSVGADRIVNTAAAHHLYPGQNCLVLDFGTATTYDYVDADGNFSYTIIQPGLEISAQALFTMAAKLPEVEIQKPASVLGYNTVTGMQSGIVYGYIGSVEYIIKKVREELQTDFTVIATGGLGRVIAQETDMIHVYDADLAFKGMKILYELNKPEF